MIFVIARVLLLFSFGASRVGFVVRPERALRVQRCELSVCVSELVESGEEKNVQKIFVITCYTIRLTDMVR